MSRRPLPAVTVLAGMPGAGKTSVAARLARRNGGRHLDTDRLVEAEAGATIAEIFAAEGEAGFRAREAAAVASLPASLSERLAGAAPAPAFVSVGGGALLAPESRRLLEGLGPLLCLVADVDTLAERLAADAAARPLLAGGARADGGDEGDGGDGAGEADASARLAALLRARRALYESLPWRVETAGLDVDRVAERAEGLARAVGEVPPPQVVRVPRPGTHAASASGASPAASYVELVGPGLLSALGPILRARGMAGPVLLVTDANVGPLWAEATLASLRAAGLPAALFTAPADETTKSPAVLAELWDALAAAGVDRGGLVLALGGGVVTDLAGFAAATWLRGVRLVSLPTSLLAMVDAAIGGKTGINLPAGKNLAGAFWPPSLVLADAACLATLPAEELRGGMAEVVKHALLTGEEALAALEARAAREGAPRPPEATDEAALAGWAALVAEAARRKASIVGQDPYETRGGPRELLNLGHTFAHGLERASGYRISHGRAVSVGLVLAARLSARRGLAPEALAPRIDALLAGLGLPRRWSGPEVDAVLEAMAQDKKRAEGRLRFVLLRGPGQAFVADDVPVADARAVLAEARD